jgi:cytochrome c-type biogenesis protein CcmH
VNRTLIYPSFRNLFAGFWLLLAALFSISVIAQTSANAQTIAVNEQAQTSEQKQKPVQEYAENYVFEDPKQRKQFLELTAELRCPKCQNQNIADSDAPIAHDMRRKVYELMQEGSEKPEVIGWMKQRYGDFVHYQPPVTPFTIWLWLMPVMFALMMLFIFVRRRKLVTETDNDSEKLAAKLARADKMLKDE